MKRVAVLDPGRCKCGLVLTDLQLGLVREGHVLAPEACLLYTSPSPRDLSTSRMPSSA